jgi:hypothetical protein
MEKAGAIVGGRFLRGGDLHESQGFRHAGSPYRVVAVDLRGFFRGRGVRLRGFLKNVFAGRVGQIGPEGQTAQIRFNQGIHRKQRNDGRGINAVLLGDLRDLWENIRVAMHRD